MTEFKNPAMYCKKCGAEIPDGNNCIYLPGTAKQKKTPMLGCPACAKKAMPVAKAAPAEPAAQEKLDVPTIYVT